MNAFILRRRRGIAAALFALALVAVHPPSFAQPAPADAKNADPLPAIAATSAVLAVDTPETKTDTEAALQRRINTHIITLRSEQNLRRVISNPNSETRKTSWFTSAANPLERAVWLRDHLHVKQVTGTALIEVSLPEVADSSDRRTILREICDTYLNSAKMQQTDALGDRSYVLNTVKIKIDARLKQITDDLRAKQMILNTDGGGMGRMGMKEMELSKVVAEQIEAQLRAEKAGGEYKSMSDAIQKGQDPPGLDEVLRGDSRFGALQRHLDDLELGLEAAKSNAGEKNPAADAEVAQLAAQAAYVRKKLQALKDEITAKAKVSLLESAQLRAADAENLARSLSARGDNLKMELGDLNNSMILYLALQEEQKGLREQLRSVRQQIEDIMALQAGRTVGGIRWHLMPEADGF